MVAVSREVNWRVVVHLALPLCSHRHHEEVQPVSDLLVLAGVTRQLMCFSGIRRRSLRVRRRFGAQDMQIQLRTPLTNLDSEPKNAAWLPSVNRFDTTGRDGRRSCRNNAAIRNGHT